MHIPRDIGGALSLTGAMKCMLVALAIALCASADAAADVWNLYSPCEEAGVDPQALSWRWRDEACDPTKLDELHALFAAPALAELAGPGGQAVRVTITNGYDREIVVAEAVRRAGDAEARAIARGPGDADRQPHELMQAVLDADAWDALAQRAAGQASAMALLPEPSHGHDVGTNPDDEPILVCSHGWSVTAETYGFGQPRVLARDTCDFEGEDEVWELGWRTMQAVFAGLDGCIRLDARFFRNDADRLAFCLGLSGDVAVAASASNAVMPFLYDDLADPGMRYVLGENFALTLLGEQPIVGADAAFARWREYVAAGDFLLYFDTALGVEGSGSLQSAEMQVLLVDEAISNARQTRYAEVTQTWRRDGGFWVMETMSIGPWQTLVYPDEEQ